MPQYKYRVCFLRSAACSPTRKDERGPEVSHYRSPQSVTDAAPSVEDLCRTFYIDSAKETSLPLRVTVRTPVFFLLEIWWRVQWLLCQTLEVELLTRTKLDSGFLNRMEPGDVVLAEKRFSLDIKAPVLSCPLSQKKPVLYDELLCTHLCWKSYPRYKTVQCY